METTDWISLLSAIVSGPLGAWLTARLMRRKHEAEIGKLRAEIAATQTDTRGDELENLKNGMTILMEQVVDPLKKEINAVRKELARLRHAVEKVNSCPYADTCPVRDELQRAEVGGNQMPNIAR